jgi:hypothetical protein
MKRFRIQPSCEQFLIVKPSCQDDVFTALKSVEDFRFSSAKLPPR